MRRDDRLLVSNATIYDARHQLVTLCVEPAIGAGLRYAAGKLTIAEVVVRRDGDLLRTSECRTRWVVPVHMILPDVDAIVLHDLLQLRSTGGDHDVWRAGRRRLRSIDVCIVQ